MNRFNFLVLLLLIGLASCETVFEADLSNENNSTTTLNIRLTDGPIDLEEVNIDLQGIRVKGPGGFEEIPLETNAGIYNLLDFQNGIDTLIAYADLQLERITEVRLILGDNNTVVVDGETYALKIPSGSQSGLKIKACLDLLTMPQYDLLLDFDAGASIHRTGNGKYIMRPVIKIMNSDARCDDMEEEEEGEEDDSFDDLPQRIIDSLEQNFSGYDFDLRRTLLCGETEAYEIKAILDIDTLYLYFDLEGLPLQQAVTIPDSELPEAVTIALETDYPGFILTADSAFRIAREDGEIWYQVRIQTDNEEQEVTYKADGIFVCGNAAEEEEGEEEEHDHSAEDLPQAVQDYISANYPGFNFSSTSQRFCDGTDVYVLEGKNGPTTVLLYFDLDGEFLQSAKSFDEQGLPNEVKGSIASDYADYRIMNNKTWEIERANGDLWYRVYIKKNNSSKKVYVIYAADGTFICEEE
ncbi:MAG: DUF4382 domain-containing protein [Saprospiraceae bacterium]